MLAKLYKRIDKLITRQKMKAQQKSPEVAYKATFYDTARYILSEKYSYKRKSNGVKIKTVVLLLLVISSILIIAFSIIRS